MSLAFWYWLIIALWVLFSFWRSWPSPEFRYLAGGHILVFLLFVLLGWKVFGSAFESLVR